MAGMRMYQIKPEPNSKHGALTGAKATVGAEETRLLTKHPEFGRVIRSYAGDIFVFPALEAVITHRAADMRVRPTAGHGPLQPAQTT